MTADASIWAYPWDLFDLGLAPVRRRMDEIGLNMISVATSYHAGRFLQPGNPRRQVYFPQDGTVYYQMDPARWSGQSIVPQQADIVAAEGDMLAGLIRQRDAGGPGVSCWTVCLHNTRLGMKHPEHVMRTAMGDAHHYALCPSSPAARQYVGGMAREISQVYTPNRIELESPDFMGFDHGFHHEKDGLGLLPEDRFLLGVCFCDHCLASAEAANIPAKAAQAEVARVLTASFARELPVAQFPDFPSVGAAAFQGHDALAAYLDWRSSPVTALIAEIRAEMHAETELLLIDAEGTEAGGVNLPEIAPHLDGVLHCAYETATDRIGQVLSDTRKILGPDRKLIAGFQMFYPNVKGADDLHDRVSAARDHADGFNFYNLGLVPDARLDWIRHSL